MNLRKIEINKIYLFLFSVIFILPLLGRIFDVGFFTVYKFVAAVIFVFYVPGSIILKIVKPKAAPFTYGCLCLILGLFISSHISKAFFYFGIQEYLWVLYTAIGILYLIFNVRKIKNRFSGNAQLDIYALTLIGLCLITAFIIWYVIFPSGRLYSDGMRFYRANAFDGMNQWAISEELARSYPRQFPFWTGAPMVGYHIGAYYWQGLLIYLTHIEPVKLFFRLCPLYIKTLAILATFAILKEIKNRNVAILSVLAIFFIGDLSWIFPALDRIIGFAKIGTVYFMGDVLQNFMFNPPLVYGILAMLGGIFFLNAAKSTGSFLNILLCGYFFGMLFSSKAFFGIIFMMSLFLLSLYEIFKEKNSVIFKIFFIALVFSLIEISATFTVSSRSIFEFSPLYFPIFMANEANWRTELIPVFVSFIIFTIGSIGIKLLAFLKIGTYAKNWRSTLDYNSLLVIALVFSFLLTHLFVFKTLYKGATINFYTLFLIILGIYFAEWLTEFLKKKALFKKGAVISAVLIFASGSTYFSLLPYMPKYNRYKVINHDELEVFDFLRNNTEEEAVIIHNRKPLDWYQHLTQAKYKEGLDDRDSFVSALGGRRVVLECGWHVGCGISIENFEEALRERKNDVKTLFSTKDIREARNILDKYNASYMLVDKNQDINFQKRRLLKNMFSNRTATLYKVLR